MYVTKPNQLDERNEAVYELILLFEQLNSTKPISPPINLQPSSEESSHGFMGISCDYSWLPENAHIGTNRFG